MICNTVSVLIILFLSLGSAIIASGQVEMTRDAKVVKGGNDGQCPSMEERERAINEIKNEIIASVTGNNLIDTCNGTPGWRRVAFINMTDTSYNCPTGLNLTSYSKRTCGRPHTSEEGCSSTTFNVGGLPYSQVCGRIRGYQFGFTSAFYPNTEGIDSHYVTGVSLTHGASGGRQHIWTFASGLTEGSSYFPNEHCPCDTSRYHDLINIYTPAFVGNDYFCESGTTASVSFIYQFYPDDVLWDGQDCTSTSTCCQFNNPPWFTKNLPNSTIDDIELRICTINKSLFQNIPLELIELYVQ